jgi:thymidylate synthase (FAD)
MKHNVRLISYSQPAEDAFIGIDDAQDLIAYCARVSNPSNQSNKKTAERLLSYLAKESHWSPFEMVSACLEIETTRDIARQILRHRSFSFQEFSQRYADPTQDLDMVKREARLQDHTNRQNSIEIENDPSLVENQKHLDLIAEWGRKQAGIIKQSQDAYNWAVENGIAKEQARAVLPEGNMMSRIYMNGTIRSWMHYIELRSGNGTQKEHREVALECAKEIEKVFPIIKKFIKK